MTPVENFEYPMVVYEDAENGERVWRGNFPGLHGCWLEAASKEEVLRLAPSVLWEYASACFETGWTPPHAPPVRWLEESGAGEVCVVRAKKPL